MSRVRISVGNYQLVGSRVVHLFDAAPQKAKIHWKVHRRRESSAWGKCHEWIFAKLIPQSMLKDFKNWRNVPRDIKLIDAEIWRWGSRPTLQVIHATPDCMYIFIKRCWLFVSTTCSFLNQPWLKSPCLSSSAHGLKVLKIFCLSWNLHRWKLKYFHTRKNKKEKNQNNKKKTTKDYKKYRLWATSGIGRWHKNFVGHNVVCRRWLIGAREVFA